MKTLFAQWHEILSQSNRDSKLSYGENRSLSLTWAPIGSSNWYRVVTDGQTDTKTESP